MRVNKLSYLKLNFMKVASLKTLVLLSFCFLSACLNNVTSKPKSTTNTISLSNPATSLSSGNFHLTSVSPDPNNLGTLYNFVGRDQEFDSFCSGTSGSCQCEYTFTQPGVGTQTVDVASVYQESNLIRCPATAVPSGVSSFDAKIIVVSGTTATGTASNTVTVTLDSTGAFAGSTNYIDLTNASTYVQVQRFQCRKRDFIRNPMDQNIIDPFQSSDPSVIYPFNFYTTNVSDSLLQFQKLPNQSWECTLTKNQDGSVHWWANPNVFSVATCTTSFCSGDQQLIYPQTTLVSGKIPVNNASATGKRRSSFALASQAYGVFQTPVTAAVAPNDYVSSKTAVIGYAAKPIPSTGGTSSCPSISLPLKATWVKLWNFRATDITSPQIVTGSQSINNSTIACNTQTGPFPSCDTTVPNGAAFGSVLPATASSLGFASRVALLASDAGSSSASACYNIDTTSILLNGGYESWLPSPYRFDVASNVPISTTTQFPWNLYAQNSSLLVNCGVTAGNYWTDNSAGNNCGGGTYAVPSGTPYDTKTQLSTQPLAPNNDNYSDQLFVVSDPSVDDNLMRNGSSAVSQYVPSTYRSYNDCIGPNKDICTKMPIHWDINVKDVGNPTGADVYPLCVLQFYD